MGKQGIETTSLIEVIEFVALSCYYILLQVVQRAAFYCWRNKMERKMIYVDNQTQGMAYGAESTQEMIREVVKHLDDDVIRVNITRRKPLDDGDERKDGGTEEFSTIAVNLLDGSVIRTKYTEELWYMLENLMNNRTKNKLLGKTFYVKIGSFSPSNSDIIAVERL